MKTLALTVFVVVFSNSAFSTPIQCGSTQRTATLNPAESCETGLGNPNGNSFFGGGWTDEGELTGNGSNDFLTAIVFVGSWGSSPILAAWAIDPTFWLTYGAAVISAHVGNGGGDPDYFAWLVTPGAISGTFEYEILAGTGGGLSNIRLWGRDAPTTVPEPSTLILLGIGLLGIGLARRKTA